MKYVSLKADWCIPESNQIVYCEDQTTEEYDFSCVTDWSE